MDQLQLLRTHSQYVVAATQCLTVGDSVEYVDLGEMFIHLERPSGPALSQDGCLFVILSIRR